MCIREFKHPIITRPWQTWQVRPGRVSNTIKGRFNLRSVHFIYVRQTPDICQHMLLERPINAYVQFSFAINTLNTRCAHDTDMIDKLNEFEITSVYKYILATYMVFYHARCSSVVYADVWRHYYVDETRVWRIKL